MRTIKFRCWRKEEKIMSKPFRSLDVENENMVIMQFTGLLDKNGKEIYEGDIVENTTAVRMSQLDFKNAELEKRGVKPPDYICVIRDIRLLPFYEGQTIDDVEIIGNIYENPELIDKKI